MHSWLRCLALLAFFALHSSLFISGARAQDENAAFYIYQNDGHFDGFFYDEVEKISYSRFDTLGIEYEDYVSQIIVTADSTYQIMLSAIDSVGFQQPEIRFNKQLRNMSDLGMIPYLKSQDGMILRFSGNMPSDLRPHQQDVLVCYDFDRYEGGFGGKVRYAAEENDDYVVICDSLTDMSDIFEQFITVEEYASDRYGNNVRRRMAGSKKVAGGYDGTIWSFSANPHLPFSYKDFTASLDLNMGMEIKLKASWNIPLWGAKQFKIEVSNIASVGASLTMDFKMAEPLSFETKFNNLAPVYVPAAAPIFRVKCLPEGFLRSEIHATASLQTKKFKKQISQSFEFNDWKVSARMNFGDVPQEPGEENEPDINLFGSINGFVQGGVKFPFVIRTNEFFESILSAEVAANIYAGPKLSGEINFNTIEAITSSSSPTFWHNSLKDSKATFSPFCVDYEVKSLVKAFVGANDTLTLIDGSRDLITWDRYMMPAFENTAVVPTVDNVTPADQSVWRADGDSRLYLNYKPKRDLLRSVHLGAVVYNKKGELVQWGWLYADDDAHMLYSKEEGYDEIMPEDASDFWKKMNPADGLANIHFNKSFLPGKYKAYPAFSYIRYANTQLIAAEPAVEFEIPALYFKPLKDTLIVAAPADTSEYVIVTPTSGSIYVSSVSRPDDANETHYTRGETMFRHTSKDTLFIKTAPNDLVFEQRATKLELVAVGYDEEGWTQTEPQYITVRQNPAGVFTGFYFRWKQSIEYDYEGTYEGRHYGSHATVGVDYEFSTSYDNHGTLESERNGDIVTMHYYGTQYNGGEYDINLTVDAAKRKLLGGHFSIGTWSGDFEEKENFDSDKKVKIINLNSTTWKNYESVNISTETVCNSLTPY